MSVALALAWASSTAAHAIEADFHADVAVELVEVPAVAIDGAGRPVADLKPSEWRLEEDGAPVSLSHYQPPAARPRQLVLVWDEHRLTPLARSVAGSALLEQTGRLLAAGQRLTCVRLGEDLAIDLVDATDGDALAALLVRWRDAPTGISGGDTADRALLQEIRAGDPLPPPGTPPGDFREIGPNSGENVAASTLFALRSRLAAKAVETRATLAQLRALIGALGGGEQGAALLVVGNGWETRPGESLRRAWLTKYGDSAAARGGGSVELDRAPPQVAAELDPLLAEAGRAGVPIYGLTPGSRNAPVAGGELVLRAAAGGIDLTADAGANLLDQLAAATGGRSVAVAEGLPALLDGLAADFAATYRLGYLAPHPGGRGEHRWRLATTRPGVVLRYPRGYRAGDAAGRADGLAAAALWLGRIPNPLGISVGPAAGVAAADAPGARQLELRLPLDRLSLRPERGEQVAEVTLTVRVRGSAAESPPVAVPIRLPNRDLAAALARVGTFRFGVAPPAGTSEVVVLVRDELAGADAVAVVPWPPPGAGE